MLKLRRWAFYLTLSLGFYLFISQYNDMEKTQLRAIAASDNLLAYFNHYTAFKIQQNSKATNEYNRKLLLNYNDHGSIFNDFLQELIDLLIEERININILDQPLNLKLDLDFVKWIKNPESIISKGYLMSLSDKQLGCTKSRFAKIKKSHAQFVKNMPKLNERFYSGRGYVMVGGFKDRNWLSTIALMSLSRTGAKIPTEVMIFHPDDFEADFCNLIAPSYNAKCIKAYEIFGMDKTKFFLDNLNFEELKILSILLSSFQDVMYLNANTFVINNPDDIFNSKVYKTYKMVTWPDFERRTTSPLYYEITGSGVDENQPSVRYLNDILTFNRESESKPTFGDSEPNSDSTRNFHDKQGTIPDWSSFDDLIMINKVQFFDTILLALYYSINGPNVYYPLLSQVIIDDEMNINGKEVLSAAANYFGLSYYQLFKRPELDISNDEEKLPLGVLQFNPQDDYDVFTSIIEHVSARDDEPQQRKNDAEPRQSLKAIYNLRYEANRGVDNNHLMPLFFNSADANKFSNNPFDVFDKFKKDIKKRKSEMDSENTLSAMSLAGTRLLSNAFPRSRFDYEQYIWKIAKMILCDEKLKFRKFENRDTNGLCGEFIDLHISELDKNEEELARDFYERVKDEGHK